MSIEKTVIDRIVAAFEEELKKHLFSNKELPKFAEVRTVYPNCTQSIRIDFKEDDNAEIH